VNTSAIGLLDTPGDGLFRRLHRAPDAEFDITAMIDLVFMMNIYFLVTFITVAMGEINLPAASHAAALDRDKATVVTVLAGPDWRTVFVYLGEGKKGTPIMEADDQVTQIANEVERAAAQGKTAVLIKAEKGIRLREIKRIAGAAAREGMTLHIAIIEKESTS
jgi:biopolymer transport protein ExbD